MKYFVENDDFLNENFINFLLFCDFNNIFNVLFKIVYYFHWID